jgi:hypothetical protein
LDKKKESVSRIEGEVEVKGKGKALLYLYRHLSPLTVNALIRAMPLESRVSVQGMLVCIFTNLRLGVEKPKTDFSKGDVAFLPLNSTLCFFLDKVSTGRPLNYVGRIENGIEVIESIRPGDVILVRVLQDERQ